MGKLTVSMTDKERLWGFIYLLLQMLCLPSLLNMGNLLLSTPLSEAQMNLVYFALNFICVILICRKFLWQSLKLVCKKPSSLQYVIYGLAFYRLSIRLMNFLTLKIMPEFTNVNDQTIFAMSQDFFLPVALGLVLLVPVVEETLHRGLVFRLLYERSKVLGYLLSAAIFASIHVLSYLGSYSPGLLMLCFVQYLPAGLCLAWVYVKADNIFAPILLHMIINLIGVFTMR